MQCSFMQLLQREKQISAVISKVLPKPIADLPKGSRLAQLYGLPKTLKEQLAMRPILPLRIPITMRWLSGWMKTLSHPHAISTL